jgi:Flp pilus assembly pilin Flp
MRISSLLRCGRSSTRFVEDERGIVMTEYAVVVGVCGILVSLAIASLGLPLIAGYSTARTVLISTVP